MLAGSASCMRCATKGKNPFNLKNLARLAQTRQDPERGGASYHQDRQTSALQVYARKTDRQGRRRVKRARRGGETAKGVTGDRTETIWNPAATHSAFGSRRGRAWQTEFL